MMAGPSRFDAKRLKTTAAMLSHLLTGTRTTTTARARKRAAQAAAAALAALFTLAHADNTPPEVATATATQGDTVWVTFNEAMATGFPPGGSESQFEHTLPLVMSGSNAVQQGFVRIINHSDGAGAVEIRAIDDSGRRFGPVSLDMEARASAHFNSGDLESGNVDKGLSGGFGEGDGDWRLELSTTLDIEPLAYIRAEDGFVTSMHDLVAQGASMRYHVPLFNPGSNRSQVSRLRLVNPTDAETHVVIDGWMIEASDRAARYVSFCRRVGLARSARRSWSRVEAG